MNKLGEKNINGKQWMYWQTGDGLCGDGGQYFRAVSAEIIPGGKLFSEFHKFKNYEEMYKDLND